ncbi:hypothetical protein HHL22_02660 [Hymenobacter sp. RP-2-7]|uniref:DUF3592 domain-containing protein n=1 Tax=Hymenobacter polaris TaxID=2682546 RepID=A0A7Y0ABE2_9BACT|nr:hypothetical protein [Hymenobacter polaris]NML64097.1 hypothetical protein [Hymenobacter polaris]
MKAQKTPWKKKKIKSFSFSSLLSIILILTVFGYFAYLLSTGAIRQKQLEAKSIITQAVVIDKKNYFGNSPVSQEFSYSYEFVVDGKKYTGNTRDSKCRIGDIVKIKYVPTNPAFNVKLD